MKHLRHNLKTMSRTTLHIMALIIMLTLQLNVAHAAQKFTCADVAPSTPTDKTKGWIVTILEEQIGSPTAQSEKDNANAGITENVINCFRVTNVIAKTDTTPAMETTEYQDSCPDAATFCKRVQVYFAQSGAELLYSYVGRIYKWAAGTIGIVTVLFLVVGGIEISAAQGDSGKIEKAKERIMQSLAGLVLLFLSALILYTVNPNFFTAG